MQGWLTDHPFDEGAWHASQAALWGMTGSVTLAELHEDMALEVGGGDTSLVVLVARAERVCGHEVCADTSLPNEGHSIMLLECWSNIKT